jgi:SAM domain (Sterile alpha motif)
MGAGDDPANEIDETVLPNLTAEDLKDLGVSIVGHRRKLLGPYEQMRAPPERTGWNLTIC